MDNSNREVVVMFGPQQPLVTIGRATDCVIRSNRRSVSRHHAEFRYHNGQYEVVDLESANGTYLIINDNRQRITGRLSLSHGDEVWCGDFILYFEEGLEEEQGAAIHGDYAGGYQEAAHQAPPYQGANGGAPPVYSPSGGAPFATGHDDAFEEPEYDEPGAYGGAIEPDYDSGHNEQRPYSPQAPAYTNGGQGRQRVNDPYKDVPPPQGPTPQEHEALLARFEAAQHELEQSQRELDELTDQLDAQRVEAERLKGQLEERVEAEASRRAEEASAPLREENERLERALEQAKQSASHQPDERADALETQLADAQERIEGYRRRIALAEEEAARAARLRDDLRDRERDIEQLHQELDRNREETRIARDEARKARESADRARSSLQIAERNVQEGLDQKKELERHKRLLDEVERRNREVTSECAELERLSKELEQQVGSKTSEAASLRQLANDHERRLGELTQESARAQQESKKARAGLEEISHKAERYEALAKQLDKDLTALKSSSSAQIKELSEKLETSTRDSAVANAKLTNQRDRLEQQRLALQEELKEEAPKRAALKNEIEGLKQRLRLEKRRARQHDDEDASSQQLEEARQEIARLGQVNASLRERLEQIEQHLDEVGAQATVSVPTLRATSPEGAAAVLSEADLSEAQSLLGALDRIVYAISVTDFSSLTMVEQVRLKGALRDTDVSATLQRAQELLGGST